MTQLLRAHGEAVLPALLLMVLVAGVQLGRLLSRGPDGRTRAVAVRLGAEGVAVANLAGALVITLVPGRGSFGRSLNLVPFAEVQAVWVTGGYYSAPRDEVLINLVLFVPFAFAAGFAWPRLRSFRATVGAVAAITAAIETLQFALPMGRISSVTDVLLPVLGAMAAWGVAAPMRQSASTEPVSRSLRWVRW
jgi:hypothetical protein